MLATLGLALHHGTVIVAAFLAVAKRFAVDIAERGTDFHAAGGFDIAIAHVDAANSPALAVDGQRDLVIFNASK